MTINNKILGSKADPPFPTESYSSAPKSHPYDMWESASPYRRWANCQLQDAPYVTSSGFTAHPHHYWQWIGISVDSERLEISSAQICLIFQKQTRKSNYPAGNICLPRGWPFRPSTAEAGLTPFPSYSIRLEIEAHSNRFGCCTKLSCIASPCHRWTMWQHILPLGERLWLKLSGDNTSAIRI